ncbi:MAG: hypothetical protein M1155_02265 [Patescibacteria group bacterium]|nr:hypothetical protein [Patescibacteria group bacterium]
MLKIIGYDIWRGNEKAGFVDGNHIRAHDGRKLGYFEEDHIRDMDGHKLAYISGDHLYGESLTNAKISLDKVNESVVGGLLPEIAKCAIYVLIGA